MLSFVSLVAPVSHISSGHITPISLTFTPLNVFFLDIALLIKATSVFLLQDESLSLGVLSLMKMNNSLTKLIQLSLLQCPVICLQKHFQYL